MVGNQKWGRSRTSSIIHPLFSGDLRKRQSRLDPLENGQTVSEGSTFTYQDILDELMVYMPENRRVRSDEFRFSLTDGLYTKTGKVEFTMEWPRTEPPRLAVNTGLQLFAGRECEQEYHTCFLMGMLALLITRLYTWNKSCSACPDRQCSTS